MSIEQTMFEKKRGAILKILRAADQSEYYHSVFCNAHIDIESIKSYEDFAKIPILDKKMYANHKFSMIADSKKREQIKENLSNATDLQSRRKICEDKGIYLKVTSGSMGNPLEVIKDKHDLFREYMGLNYARKKVLGTLPKGKYIWIWPANEIIRDYFYEDGKVSIYRDTEYGYKYMMPEYSEKSFGDLSSFIKENDISWITAPPSMLCLFAEFLERKDIVIHFSYMECHSEKLFDWQSIYLKKIFGSQPWSVYSSNEIQFMAMSDYSNRMNIITQNVFIELIKDGQGEQKVYATSLCAREIPIIRYSMGDVAHWIESKDKDELNSPCIEISGYRCNDYIILEDGRKFEPFIVSDLVILLNDKYSTGVKEFVVWQTGYNNLTFYFSKNVINMIHNNSSVQEYMLYYLNSILNVCFDISFEDIDIIYKKRGTRKYKYFWGMKNE